MERKRQPASSDCTSVRQQRTKVTRVRRSQQSTRTRKRTQAVLSLVALIVVALNLHFIFQSHRRLEGEGFLSERSRLLHLHEIENAEYEITLESLPDIEVQNQTISPLMTWEEASRGKEKLLDLLRVGGVNKIDASVVQLLPTWEKVQELYGTGPVVEGLHQCSAFRGDSLGIAGMFDSGTNLAANYLETNCDFPVMWQVPWGKHVLAEQRQKHVAKGTRERDLVDPSTILPVVMIRDPYFWMQSLCRRNYGAQWLHSSEHCPNLVPNDVDYKIYSFPHGTIPVRIKYDFGLEKWDSLAHLWTAWYRQYYQDADYPRLMVRYEDFLFYPKQVTQMICECAGGTLRKHKFIYWVNSAKYGSGHGNSEKKTSWVSAMIRYGKGGMSRTTALTPQDLNLAKDALDWKLMQSFLYTHP